MSHVISDVQFVMNDVSVCLCQGMLSLRLQNTESLLDYQQCAARLTSQLTAIEDTTLSHGWCTSLTQPDDMTRFRQVTHKHSDFLQHNGQRCSLCPGEVDADSLCALCQHVRKQHWQISTGTVD